jgi:L-histidine N-alpha-methyltransferase
MFRTLDPNHCGPDTRRFRDDVLRGLARPAKELPCKYFYDERGSRLFEQICELDEYYLTRTELAIMRRHAGAMAARLGPRCLLIEFGSGSSTKTRLLLDHLEKPAAYVPVDISGDHLERSARILAAEYPGLAVLPVHADFTAPLTLARDLAQADRRVVYFPGSTIGNFTPPEAVALLRGVHALCGPGGGLLLGADLKKDRQTLEAAYNDAQGVTREFNLNLLQRINRELGGNFCLDRFRHHAFYNAAEGRIEMHLISTCRQMVRISTTRIGFAPEEGIRTEYSYKYAVEEVAELAAAAGMRVDEVWTDERRLFGVLFLDIPYE